MLTVTKKQLKNFELPSIDSATITKEQARVIAEIIYFVLENSNTHENNNVA